MIEASVTKEATEMFTAGTLAVRITLLAAALAVSATLAACGTSPTGRPQIKFKSEDEMAAMGEQSFQQIRAQTPASRDQQATAIVNCVATAIIGQLPVKQRFGWEVVVFDSNQVNAFALPGRKIGVFEGIFRVARNQDQLATVIGHEVAHVIAQHANERVSTSTAAGFGAQAVSAGGGAGGAAAGAALGVGLQYGVLMPFNRKQETEADVLGLDLMAKAGFDPRQSLPLWENMERQTGEKPAEFVSTHPSGETRSLNLNNQLPIALEFYEEAKKSQLIPDCGF
jgi:predicted Zn-dependent protease